MTSNMGFGSSSSQKKVIEIQLLFLYVIKLFPVNTKQQLIKVCHMTGISQERNCCTIRHRHLVI